MQRPHVNVKLGVKWLVLKASGFRQREKNGKASFHLIGKGKRGGTRESGTVWMV